LAMDVLDANGSLVGTGERQRIVVHQGSTLFVHVYGKRDSDDTAGAGAYSLIIYALPQGASVEASSLLPGVGRASGGPTTSITLVLQGDRLDPASAENPANYKVVYLGRDGVAGTADDEELIVGAGLPSGAQSVVYDPGSNVDVASGLTYPTAVR